MSDKEVTIKKTGRSGKNSKLDCQSIEEKRISGINQLKRDCDNTNI